jgi:hypothetical protein
MQTRGGYKKMTKARFEKDYKTGEWAEDKLTDRLRLVYNEVDNFKTYNPYWDIHIIDTDKLIEVKYDKRSNTTDNFFIECNCAGVPSGINITKAEVWAHCTGQEFTFIPTVLLKEIASPYHVAKCFIDEKWVHGHLVPKSIIKDCGITLSTDECSDVDLINALNQYGSS